MKDHVNNGISFGYFLKTDVFYYASFWFSNCKHHMLLHTHTIVLEEQVVSSLSNFHYDMHSWNALLDQLKVIWNNLNNAHSSWNSGFYIYMIMLLHTHKHTHKLVIKEQIVSTGLSSFHYDMSFLKFPHTSGGKGYYFSLIIISICCVGCLALGWYSQLH